LSDTDHSAISLRSTRLDIPADIRLYLVQVMNETLTWTADLRCQVKQALWHTKGKAPAAHHTLFREMALELDDYADLLADRIAVLGGTARVCAAESNFGEYPGATADPDQDIVALADSFAECSKSVRHAISQAIDVEDAVTAALFTEISQGIEWRLCCLESYVS
jgi:starvation-inducible DNA-binding protein